MMALALEGWTGMDPIPGLNIPIPGSNIHFKQWGFFLEGGGGKKGPPTSKMGRTTKNTEPIGLSQLEFYHTGVVDLVLKL